MALTCEDMDIVDSNMTPRFLMVDDGIIVEVPTVNDTLTSSFNSSYK